ncbi:uncharacterized protein C1orf112-like isoform X2 [Mauremys reevesii]|nr:uncharacterized protein C1orf112-like isoform X2 [Mauremys reevesii]
MCRLSGPQEASSQKRFPGSLCSQPFFSVSSSALVSVCLPGVMDDGQAEVPVTLYHHLCVHLCAFIASTPPSHFPQLERALLDAVIGSSMITSLLAMDSWCFLAR